MITLITGGPGTGKTAWLLDQLLELRKQEPNRELYIHGVRNLRGLAHEAIYCRSQLCDICRAQDIELEERHKKGEPAKFVENWPDWKQPGSLIVVDEVQRIWRPRAGGAQPAPAVSGLETHRHYGIDFWLISQGPHLFDNFIRLLVGRHVHLVAKWNGRSQYEWPECKQDVQSRGDAVIRGYSLPKHVYNMYDSAEVHTKQEKRKPLSLYVAIGALMLVLVMGFAVFHRVNSRLAPPSQDASAAVVGGALAPPASASIPPANSSAFPDFKPTIPGVPESAPAYLPLVKVKSAPRLIGCIKTPKECKCYTNQATPYPTSQNFCNEYIAGHYFNPYRDTHEINVDSETLSDKQKTNQLASN